VDGFDPTCPLCPINGQVDMVMENGPAYLVIPKEARVKGSYLIVPERHVTDLSKLPNMWWPLFPRLLRAIPWFQDDAAFNISLNVGWAAGQRLKHLHFWIIPRTDDEGPSSGLGLGTLISEFCG